MIDTNVKHQDSNTDIISSMKHQENYDEEFAYHRCLSRLREMQTQQYQEKTLH